MSYLERLANYEKNKAEGNLHRNPFAGLTSAINSINPVNTVPALWKGAVAPEAAKMQAAVANNMRGHPIYGNLFRDPVPSSKPMLTAPGGPPQAPLGPLSASSPQPFGMLRNQGNTGPRPIRNPMDIADEWYKEVVEPLTPEKKPKSETQTPVEKAHQEVMNASNEAAKADLKEQGATEEELSAWDKFNEKFDLTRAGLAMLRGAGPGSSFWQDLGVAGQIGLDAAERRSDKDIAQAMAERKVAIDEERTDIAGRRVDISEAGLGQRGEQFKESLKISQQNADVNQQNAYTNRLRLGIDKAKSQMKALGYDPNANSTLKATTRNRANKMGLDLDMEDSVVADYMDTLAGQVDMAINSPQYRNMTPDTIADLLLTRDIKNGTLQKDTFLGFGDGYKLGY